MESSGTSEPTECSSSGRDVGVRSEARREESGYENAASADHTVLVIEDDLASGAFARAVLEEFGYRVVLADSGLAGIAAFQEFQPHCVLLDARMPVLDGYQACRRLRSLDEGSEVPIVFMTAERSVESFDRAFACGADDFLTKPVSPIDLVDRVRAGLALWRVRKSRDHCLVKGQRDRLLRGQLQQERLNLLLVHDLKAPLNAICLLAQTMLRTRTNDAEREVFQEIWQQARGMAGMVLDLLDVGKAREGKLAAHLEAVDLDELVREVLVGFQAMARQSRVELQASVFVRMIQADRKLLKRLLDNLIDNALRHTPAGTTVQVVASPRPGNTEIRVADAGPGIPTERRERIFEAFSEEVGVGGDNRGLGLTFCRLAAEAHGGRIVVEDGAPGCVMCVTVPTTAAA